MHCSLDCVGGRMMLRDLESRNGTCVNHESISEQQLEVGDEINLGTTTIVVVGIHLGV